MKDKSRQNGQHRSEEDLSEFGEVRAISIPGPDAEDRLRRLFTLLLQHGAGDGQDASEKVIPESPQRTDDQPEGEA